jgi:predicted transcriptional regulator
MMAGNRLRGRRSVLKVGDLEREFQVPVTLRLPKSLHERLHALAGRHRRSMHAEILIAIDDYLFSEELDTHIRRAGRREHAERTRVRTDHMDTRLEDLK